jgi:hypothetical protein
MGLTSEEFASLDEGDDDDPAEVERAWEEEIRRRLDEVEAGTAEQIPAEQVFSELRRRRQFGSARGLIEIADDFDAPLEGFGE